MKNTKVFNIIVFLLCLGNNISCKPHKKTPYYSPTYQLLTCSHELQFEKDVSLSKLIVIPGLTCGMLLFNQKNLFTSIQQYPLLTLFGSCLLFNFLVDATIKYKQINHTICLFQLSKIISRYMLYAIAIKNTMLAVAKKDSCCGFQEEEFFKIITYEIPLSFHELELFIFELLHNCVKTIHTLHIKIHTDIEEQIYLLCKEHVTLEDVQALYGNDSSSYPLLQNLQENPTQYYKNAALELNTLIKKQFQYMIKHQPDIS